MPLSASSIYQRLRITIFDSALLKKCSKCSQEMLRVEGPSSFEVDGKICHVVERVVMDDAQAGMGICLCCCI